MRLSSKMMYFNNSGDIAEQMIDKTSNNFDFIIFIIIDSTEEYHTNCHHDGGICTEK